MRSLRLHDAFDQSLSVERVGFNLRLAALQARASHA